jgi:hypothetical protein
LDFDISGDRADGGAVLFLTDPVHYYYNSSFCFKMIALFAET